MRIEYVIYEGFFAIFTLSLTLNYFNLSTINYQRKSQNPKIISLCCTLLYLLNTQYNIIKLNIYYKYIFLNI